MQQHPAMMEACRSAIEPGAIAGTLSLTPLAGVWYGWLRLWSGSIWLVSLSRSAFDNLIEGVAGVAIATAVMMAYVTTEPGVVTMIIMLLVAGYLLTNRAADFAKAGPKSPAADHRSAHRRSKGRSGRPALDPLPGASLHASPELGRRRCQPKRARCHVAAARS